MEACSLDDALRLALLVALVHTVSLLDMKSTRQHYMRHLGDSLTLACEFEVPYFNLFDNPVLWKKRQKHEETQINLQGNINEPFQKERRFQVNFDPKPPFYNFDLIINPLTKYDNGNYTCEVRGRGSTIMGTVTHQITVRVPVSSMFLTNFNHSNSTTPSHFGSRPDEFFFTEGEHGTLRCGATGGYPEPRLQLSVGIRDVSSQLVTRYEPIFDGSQGLRVLGYKVEMWTHTFLARPEFDGKELQCAALVPGLPPNTTSIKIRVSYAPRIKCYSARAYVNQRNVTLTCLVTSRPRSTDISWVAHYKGRETLIDNSGGHSGYRTRNEVTDETSVMATLIINRVNPRKFQEYTIIARNRVDQQRKATSLEEVIYIPTTVPTTSTSTTRKYSENRDLANNGKPFYIIASSACPTLSRLRCLVLLCVQFVGLIAELLLRR